MTDERQAGMRATSARADRELLRWLESLKWEASVQECAFGLLQKRLKGSTLRSYFTYMIYEYVVEQARIEGLSLHNLAKHRFLFDTQLPLLAEGIITVQYLENHILDGKNGILKAGLLDPQQVKKTLLGSHKLKDALYEYVATECFPTDLKRQVLVSATIRKIFRFTDIGQNAEQEWASHENFRNPAFQAPVLSPETEAFIDHPLISSFWQKLRKAGVRKDLKEYTKFYLRRIYLTNVGLFVLLAELICALLGYDGKEKKKLLRFAAELALLQQLVNDVCDFLPASYGKGTSAKLPEDAFSDLRGGNITLPLIFLDSTDYNFDTIDLAKDIQKDEKQQIVFELIKPICYFGVIPFLQDYAKKTATLLKKNNAHHKLLGEMTDIVYNGKYFGYFKYKLHNYAPVKTKKKTSGKEVPYD